MLYACSKAGWVWKLTVISKLDISFVDVLFEKKKEEKKNPKNKYSDSSVIQSSAGSMHTCIAATALYLPSRAGSPPISQS